MDIQSTLFSIAMSGKSIVYWSHYVLGKSFTLKLYHRLFFFVNERET